MVAPTTHVAGGNISISMVLCKLSESLSEDLRLPVPELGHDRSLSHSADVLMPQNNARGVIARRAERFTLTHRSKTRIEQITDKLHTTTKLEQPLRIREHLLVLQKPRHGPLGRPRAALAGEAELA